MTPKVPFLKRWVNARSYSIKKLFWKFCKFYRKTLPLESHFDKVAGSTGYGLKSQYVKRRLQHSVFLWYFVLCKVFKNNFFLQNTSRQLYLKFRHTQRFSVILVVFWILSAEDFVGSKVTNSATGDDLWIKSVLKTFANLTGKAPVSGSLFNRFSVLQACNFIR